ncbi:DEAD/DEAH box helicase [Corynebacterium phoceense]
MNRPEITTYAAITPLIYSWTTPDIPKYEGWEKIGYTEQSSADERIAQQASQLSVRKTKQWSRRALFTSEAGGRFTDHDFHEYLRKRGVERELSPKRTEWHRFAGMPESSLEYFNDFAGQDYSKTQTSGAEDYVLRNEQEAAVAQALSAFDEGYDEVLWNAKPRFGKTLTTYDLLRKLDVRHALIVTNRPAIANSWFDDFERFIGHQTNFKFVSESPSLSNRSPLSRKEWTDLVLEDADEKYRLIEFVSLQDLKGSEYFGGSFDKLEHIANLHWDILIIDEAHEGIDTVKTDIAFEQISRNFTLHLSGTPFRALASGKFEQEQIFNWTYGDEREALETWSDEAEDNPYAVLPQMNLFTYQVSRMISDRLTEGVALEEDEANIDYAFDLNSFFATKDSGYFEHEADIEKFLDCLTKNEKYPFSTPELRDEVRHSFWLLDRVASAKALQRLLKRHEVFKDYTIVLAAGDGRSADADLDTAGKSYDRVRKAIEQAEKNGGKTITLSVGQLTTGVTIPEWTAVMMLSNLSSPALYMQAAFRSQSPCIFERSGLVLRKKNAYIFDFAPERTLTIYDAFANNLRLDSVSAEADSRQANIRRLLNFFPVIGEDSEGKMVELDATQVLTFPQIFKAREVVRRGFLSNLLFDNVSGIFRYAEHYKEILDKLPAAKAGKLKAGREFEIPDPLPAVDDDGNAHVDFETVINPKVQGLGKPVWDVDEITTVTTAQPRQKIAREIAKMVEQKLKPTREKLVAEYGLTAKQTQRDEKKTAAKVEQTVERALTENSIAQKRLEHDLAEAATEAEAREIEQQKAAQEESFRNQLAEAITELTDEVPVQVVTREEEKKEQKRVNSAFEEARAHLRGFARTIPMFLMAYGDRAMTLATFDDFTPDDVFEELAGISEAEFRVLRDGQVVHEEDGTETEIPGLFDELVFNQSIQEFLDRKEALADYFDDSLEEDIFAYIPQQKTSLVFTPQEVVSMMVDELESRNPGIFSDPTKTFADLFSTAGLFLMEIVRRLDSGLEGSIPDREERLRHILTTQIFEMTHNEIHHRITIEAVSGGVPQRKKWIESSGHFQVGNLSAMDSAERELAINKLQNGGK